MLKSIDVDYCIVGHSERRKYFGETNEVLAEKINRLIENNMSHIYCVGEVLEEREAGRHFEVVKEQLEKGLFHLDGDAIYDAIIAYEPVWAIGTGKTATPEQAQEIHAFIRGLVAEKFGKQVAEDTTILYGGSCNEKNAAELFACPDIDGGLIGGAALVAEKFLAIIAAR
jgi:triosephosphate isomerase